MEPKFSPDTAAARRADTAAERPGMKAFDDADLPGYAVVTVDGPRVTAKIFPGLSRRPWRPVALSALQTPSSAAPKNPSSFGDCRPPRARSATRPRFRRDPIFVDSIRCPRATLSIYRAKPKGVE